MTTTMTPVGEIKNINLNILFFKCHSSLLSFSEWELFSGKKKLITMSIQIKTVTIVKFFSRILIVVVMTQLNKFHL